MTMGYCDLREGELFVHEGKQETRTIKKGFIPSIVKAVRKTARPASLCVCETPASILSVTPALNSLYSLFAALCCMSSPGFSLPPFNVTVHPNKAPQNIYMVDRKAKSFVQSMT